MFIHELFIYPTRAYVVDVISIELADSYGTQGKQINQLHIS